MTHPDRSLLGPIQRGLERLYRLERAPDVADFVFATPKRHPREELLVRPAGDGLEIRLVLDAALLAGARGLEDTLLLVEGVSHYLCVVFRARQGRPVTAMELELQAEVDKFVACLALWRGRRRGRPPAGVVRRALSRFAVSPHLRGELRARYDTSATMARRYADSLDSRFVRSGRTREMGDELRRFYRMGLAEKRAHIERRAA